MDILSLRLIRCVDGEIDLTTEKNGSDQYTWDIHAAAAPSDITLRYYVLSNLIFTLRSIGSVDLR